MKNKPEFVKFQLFLRYFEHRTIYLYINRHDLYEISQIIKSQNFVILKFQFFRILIFFFIHN